MWPQRRPGSPRPSTGAPDLRSYLEELSRRYPEELRTVQKAVDPGWEVTAVAVALERVGRRPALLFKRVDGTPYPVVTNLFASRRRMALALGVEERELSAAFRAREARLVDPELVDGQDAPVRQVVATGEEVTLRGLPRISHNEKDSGPYITSGAMVVKDPDTGIRNIGIYRHKIHDDRRLGIHLAETSHAWLIYQKYRDRGETMPVAITVGHHPAFYLGVLSFVPFGTDEYSVVGALMERPLRLVRAATVPLEVPADAEFVIEGYVPPEERADEGPFGEYGGTYGKVLRNPVIHVTGMMRRADPVYLDVVSGYPDHQLLGGTPRLSFIHRMASVASPGVREVFMPPSAYCRLACYVSMRKRVEGEPKNVACAVLAADPFIRYVIVVDEDVDVFDERAVLEAVYRNVRAESDVFSVPGAKGHPLDPLVESGGAKGMQVTKIGIDATRPVDAAAEKARPAGLERVDLRAMELDS
ncbi:decarboxylase UbiD [Limnochorda pilosa]|uniref:Decarboxylase UbiD n=2 Tax=Limnochorda pilosa TaxID=1555112 RepID=A0A0K2SM84_LIMPI|nr:UbiD family decarboxylase [Limnochorda pilosa]BAS28228.1 decarboxylase UbiD [Limnochorda pilosa]